ncbi:AMP-binding protein [Mycolicibacterium sp. 018/SC-01/001]|uniref:AMP-binding protein n=1 Tax=Mycolicibacterium sp. 018/SC-01/001 TaxID=2592069 RepID=UPI00163D40CD|nr:AMP-binding protein [Mycolicibacterium sp. 018/SC-01/001]
MSWPDDFPATWTGCPRLPLPTLLAQATDTFGDRPVLLFDDGTALTGNDLRRHAERFAGYLATVLQPGERVALAMGNRAEYVTAYLAVIANRAIVVSLSPEIGSHEAEFAVTDAHCVLAIADDRSHQVLTALRATGSTPLRDVITVGDNEPDGFAHLTADTIPLNFTDVDAALEDLIDIGYTSGTTGLPKALAGNHAETLRYIDVHLRLRRLHDDGPQRMLMPLQLHYGDPLTWLFGAMCCGDSLVLMRRFSASRFWEVARTTQATTILTIGSVPSMLLSQPESPADRDHDIRSAIALAIPPQQHAELERRFGFSWTESYGSSESGPAIKMPLDVAAEFVGTGALGIPLPDVQARLIDEQGQLVEGPGTGELELSGEILFSGYLDNPSATAEVLHDGWLRTGDLMRRDDRGVYYFLGRSKEVIRRSGINIAPTEVEAVLRQHPDVVDAAVVPVPDAMMGEEIKAYVELTPKATFDPRGLADFCAERLSRHKVPRYIELRTTAFPRTPSQRIPKKQLMVDGMHRTTHAWDRALDSEPAS